ncbi:MAG: autotransporter-associated beta strand repeat-containing protein [Akkermansiaceae bacterium]|nr:autotransporter-associated beta strand repeat-containing protein [Akkermansiaceae bacterium]MCP5543849.1 autotransporter-associated beta strand repeat-containing protein [Akkermansiaceae bacterium]MCP5546483.1 autotransporter-associated beta strand repeat-containing protein [Akkermansiaceae bacterium]
MKPSRFLAPWLALCVPSVAQTTLHWDGDTSGGGNGSSDVWDTSTANWNPASDYTGTAQSWNNANNDSAVFGGTAGTVTLGTAITAGGVTFETDGYTVTGSTLTLAGTTPTLSSGSGVSASIASSLAGSSGLTKTGDGTVALTGGNSLSGNIAVNAGTLQLNGSRGFNAGFFGGSRTFTVASGATLDVAGTWNTSSANVFTLNGGTLNFSLGGSEPNANYVNNLNVTNGTISGNAFRTGNGAVSYNFSGDSGSTISADLGMVRTGALPGGTITLDVADGAAANDLAISGVIHDVTGFANSTLRKSGAGTLLLGNAGNSFTGAVVVAAGTLKFGAAGGATNGVLGVLNTAVSKVTVESGATIDFNGHNDNTYGYTIAGSGVGGVGALTNTGGGIANNFRQASNIALSADASIGGTGNWSLLASSYSATTLNTAGFTLTKTGSNTIGLVNTTVSGGGTVQIDQGSLALGPVGSGVNASGTAFTLADSTGVSLSVGRDSSIGSLSGGGSAGGSVSLSSSRTLTVGALDSNTTFSGAITGAGALVKTGGGNLTFGGSTANTYTGLTTINEGTLTLAKNDSVTALAGSVVVNAGATLAADSNKSGRIADSASITITGAGAQFLFGANQNDTINVLGINDGGTVNIGGSGSNLRPNGGITSTGGGSITGSAGNGGLNFNGGTRTITVSDNTLAIGVSLSNGGLTKDGDGTLSLTASSTYSGDTTVTAGTLLVNNGSGSGTGSGLVNVSTTGTLGGSGTIGGATTISGTLAPGNSPGTLSFGSDLGLNGTAILEIELDPTLMTPGGGFNDLLAVTGNLTLDGLLNVTATSGDFLTATLGDTWTLATYGGTLTDNGLSFGSMPALDVGYSWALDTSTAGSVNLTVVPEAHTALLGALGILLLIRRRR